MTTNRMHRAITLLCTGFCLLTAAATAQVDPKTALYRAEPKGDYQYQRKGVMDGNRIRTVFFNTTEVAHWPDGMGWKPITS